MLGNELVHTSHSNEYATVGCPVLGSVAVNTHASIEERFSMWSVPKVYDRHRRTPGDEDVLRGATIREVSPAVFSSGTARSARRLYKATVQRSVSQCWNGARD
jgi:hypothetical protein